jgi:hypothetical protein
MTDDLTPYDTDLSLLIDQIEDLIIKLDQYPGNYWTHEDIDSLWRLVQRLVEIDPNKGEAA